MGSDDISPSPNGPLLKLIYFLADCIDKPAVWFKETIVKPNQQKTYWYHEKFPRVPTVDQCYEDDAVCIYEANEQYKRDRLVEKNILHILRKRSERCVFDHNGDPTECEDIIKYFENAVNNYFIKYGDLGIVHSAVYCLMKQKHRMAWERRHGPIGTGKKEDRKE